MIDEERLAVILESGDVPEARARVIARCEYLRGRCICGLHTERA